MTPHEPSRLVSLSRFAIVGLASTALDFALFNGLRELAGVPPLTAKAVSLSVAVVLTYGVNRAWVFRERAGKASTSQFILFAALALAALGVSELCLGVTYYGFGWRSPLATNLSANVVGTGLGTLLRFWAYRRWVFRVRDTSQLASS